MKTIKLGEGHVIMRGDGRGGAYFEPADNSAETRAALLAVIDIVELLTGASLKGQIRRNGEVLHKFDAAPKRASLSDHR